VKMESEQGANAADGSHQPHETPRALEVDEIKAVVQDYKTAAQNAKDAGFDGVEIHAANGYLLDQFLQSKTNKRTDEYGGSIEKRYRMLGEVIEAVKEVYPAKRIGVRISPNGNFGEMGSPDYQEQFLYTATEIGNAGVGYLHICDGVTFGFHKLGEPMTLAQFRPVVNPETVIIGSVGYTAETAEEQLNTGNADLIAFGRPFLGNPDLPERYYYGLELAEMAPFEGWFAPDMPNREKYSTPWGYSDFPTHPDVPKPL
jgi:2,4-dienoyl-CoA reductase-like NADH-dependent reductase (Old Yellow Enzyme family)